MSAAEIAQAIQDTDFFTALRESGLPYPIVLSTHLSMIAVFGGLILLTDLRLLGVALKGVPAGEMIRRTRPFKWVGFLIMITCGILLGGAKFASYYNNPYFLIKMTLLFLVGVHAIAFRKSVYRNPDLDASPVLPRAARNAAILSLVLWVGIMSNGRWIAYWEPAEEKAPAKSSLTQPAHSRELKAFLTPSR
jgi:hypothetical protein